MAKYIELCIGHDLAYSAWREIYGAAEAQRSAGDETRAIELFELAHPLREEVEAAAKQVVEAARDFAADEAAREHLFAHAFEFGHDEWPFQQALCKALVRRGFTDWGIPCPEAHELEEAREAEAAASEQLREAERGGVSFHMFEAAKLEHETASWNLQEAERLYLEATFQK